MLQMTHDSNENNGPEFLQQLSFSKEFSCQVQIKDIPRTFTLCGYPRHKSVRVKFMQSASTFYYLRVHSCKGIVEKIEEGRDFYFLKPLFLYFPYISTMITDYILFMMDSMM